MIRFTTVIKGEQINHPCPWRHHEPQAYCAKTVVSCRRWSARGLVLCDGCCQNRSSRKWSFTQQSRLSKKRWEPAIRLKILFTLISGVRCRTQNEPCTICTHRVVVPFLRHLPFRCFSGLVRSLFQGASGKIQFSVNLYQQKGTKMKLPLAMQILKRKNSIQPSSWFLDAAQPSHSQNSATPTRRLSATS